MDNTYNIDFIARCIAGHNKTDIKSIIVELEKVQKQVGGVSLVEITQEGYDALTDKDPSTIYLVSNGDKITLYTGDEPSGTVTNVAVANGGGLTVSGSPITSSGTITVGHSNSVTAKTSSSVKKFTYDAYGHVTGSSELSTAESNALASGIDSTKVAQIETNKNNISITDITAHFIADEGYTIQSGISAVYRQGKHIFGTLSIKINSGNLPTTLTVIAHNRTDIPNSGILMPCGCGVDKMSIDNIGTCYYNFPGIIKCKDTVSTNTCFNLQLDFIAI